MDRNDTKMLRKAMDRMDRNDTKMLRKAMDRLESACNGKSVDAIIVARDVVESAAIDMAAEARAEGAREALAGVRPLADEMFRSGDACNTPPDEIVSAEIAAYHAAYNALREFLAALPPHDATGSQEVGHG